MTPYFNDGKGRIIHMADCREVLPDIGPVDLVVTDPPYGLSAVARPESIGPHGTRRFDFFGEYDTPEFFDSILWPAFELTEAIMTPAASAYWWLGHGQFCRFIPQVHAKGWKSRMIAWARLYPAPPPPGAGWPSALELCAYIYRKGRTWNHRLDPPASNVLWADGHRHGNPEKVDHPTQKPLGVIRPLILASAPDNGIVLDPFCGSGTTLVAAKQLGRKAVGIEIEERFCAIAARRLEQEVFEFEEP